MLQEQHLKNISMEIHVICDMWYMWYGTCDIQQTSLQN